MKLRRVLVIFLAGLFVAGLLIWPSDREPSYEGKKLSEWLMLPERATTVWKMNELEAKSTQAFRHFGTNAIPYLLAWIKYEPPAWRDKVDNVMGKLPEALSETAPIKSLSTDEKLLRAGAAQKGFCYLGPAAKVAIPELNRLMLATNSPGCSWRAATSLSYIGQDALPVLLVAVQTRKFPAGIGFLCFMQTKGADMRPATPVLLDCLNDPDVSLAKSAALCLAALRIEPDKVIPALIRALDKEHDPVLRKGALTALSRFGDAARPAIPAVIQYLSDPDPDVARAARAFFLLRFRFELMPRVAGSPRNRNDFPFSADALACLGDAGDAARPIVPDLLEIIRNPELRSDLLPLMSNTVFTIAPEALGGLARPLTEDVSDKKIGTRN